MDQVDSLDLQLKLKSDEVRTLYYNSWGKTEDSTGVQRKRIASRRKPVKRTTLQYPCLEKDKGKTSNGGTVAVVDFVQNIDTSSTPYKLRPPNKICRNGGQRTRKSVVRKREQEHDGKSNPVLPVLDSEETARDTRTARTNGAESHSSGLDTSSLGDCAVKPAAVEAGEECPRCAAHITGDESTLGKSPSSFDVIKFLDRKQLFAFRRHETIAVKKSYESEMAFLSIR
jgi:hypothetical protein